MIGRWKAFQSPLTNMKFIAVSERDEDGVWIAQCPAIPGGVSQEATRGIPVGVYRAIAIRFFPP